MPYGVAAFITAVELPAAAGGLEPVAGAGGGKHDRGQPAEDTPLSTLYFCKLVEQRGIPPAW